MNRRRKKGNRTMWRILVVASMLFGLSNLVAADPSGYLEKQKDVYSGIIQKANQELEIAKRKRDEKVFEATKKYIEALEKVKVYWTKKGKLDRALEYDKQIKELQALVDAGKVDFVPTKDAAEKAQSESQKSTRLNMNRIVGVWRDSNGGLLTFQHDGGVEASYDSRKDRKWKYIRNNEYELSREGLKVIFRISEGNKTMINTITNEKFKRVANL